MNYPSSHIILQVERAANDLRRGQPVILLGYQGKDYLVAAGEYAEGSDQLTDSEHPAVRLMKFAGLLPIAIISKAPENRKEYLSVEADAISKYPAELAHHVEKVSEAVVPLAGAENTKIIAFRPRFGHQEHLAIIVGEPEKIDAPLVRLHSSCITGDVLGSLRCDCGSQLQKSMTIIKKHGAGAIVYLSQEGRGISIANKLRAYELQDHGLDTVEANEALGFLSDERDYAVAASMLKILKLIRITLVTNNPDKMKALAKHGIEVVRREPVVTETNLYNQKYLHTKESKMGHTLYERPE